MLLRIGEFCKRVGLSRTAVLRLEEKGIIKLLRTPGGYRRFTEDHVKQVLTYYQHQHNNVNNIGENRAVIYARVSTSKQEDFLKHQVNVLKEYAIKNGLTVHECITDIASSFNFNRPGLQKLLDLVFTREVKYIVVYDIDRLTRFAFTLLETIFKRFGVEIIVVDKSDPSQKDDITQELIAFIHYITSKIYGRHRYKKKLKELICDENGSASNDT